VCWIVCAQKEDSGISSFVVLCSFISSGISSFVVLCSFIRNSCSKPRGNFWKAVSERIQGGML